MRILLLAPHPFFQERGTPLAERELLEGLSEAGHELHVLTYHEGESVVVPNCRIHRIPSPPFVRDVRPGLSVKKLVCDLFLTVACLRLVRRIRFDVIHAVEEGAFIALLLKKLHGGSYVYDMDSALTGQAVEQWRVLRPFQPLLLRLEKRAVRESLCVLAVCRLLEDRARAFAPGKPVARIEDVSLLEDATVPAERIVDSLDPCGPVVMYVGNLEAYQGIDLLLEGFSLAQRHVPEAHLVVIGGHPDQIEPYEGMAVRLGIAHRTHFLGPRPHAALKGYLEQADVLVSPRISGVNTPMKVYSYLDSERPLAATRLPTHTQVLDDEIACLFDPDPGSMADALIRLLRDPEWRAVLAARARHRVAEEFSRTAHRRKLRRFYALVQSRLGEPSGPAPGEAELSAADARSSARV